MPRKKKRQGFKESEGFLSPSTKKSITIIILFAVALVSLLAIFGLAGKVGAWIDTGLHVLLGHLGFWTFPIIMIVIGYLSINKTVEDEDGDYYEEPRLKALRWVGLGLLIISYSGLFHLSVAVDEAWSSIGEGMGGGVIGFMISYPLQKMMSFWPTLIVLVALLVISLLLFFETSIENIFKRMKQGRNVVAKTKGIFGKLNTDQEDDYSEEEDTEDGFESRELADDETDSEQEEDEEGGEAETQNLKSDTEDEMPVLPKKKRPKIDIPLDLLSNKSSKPTAGDIKSNQMTVQDTLANFGIEVEMGEVSVGPTVTQYTFKPSKGVKVSQITTLSNDLALALAAHPIRIEAPIPGKSLVGVEVPNQKIALVTLREILESEEFKNRKHNMMMVLGKDVAGKPWLADLTKMPHLLVAGATNSGKTVCLNTIIVSLLFQNQPDDLRLILVDPKRVEMPCYNEIPHLLTPVVTDVKKTINSLKWVIGEMDRRFHVLSAAGKRNIQSYNQAKPKDKLPYIVVIVDELADLMSVASVEVEAAIIRLAQMARAVGIHLILATQRPSVDIITGLIKANIPGRIAFSVASLTDSRTILDGPGAEKLLGRGDMLFSCSELSKPKRVQGAYVSDKEIEDVVGFLRSSSTPDYNPEVVEKMAPGHGIPGISAGENADDDDLFSEAKQEVINAGKASASYLQRKLRIGYARAARLLDLLEEAGVIGPAEGAKPRDVLIKPGEEEIAPKKIEYREYEPTHAEKDDSDDETDDTDDEEYTEDEDDAEIEEDNENASEGDLDEDYVDEDNVEDEEDEE